MMIVESEMGASVLQEDISLLITTDHLQVNLLIRSLYE